MRSLLLVNPKAGRGGGLELWQRLAREVGCPADTVCTLPASAEETQQLAADAARGGAERVVCVGGDGTVQRIGRGLFGSETILGVVPAGTGNDFARNLGLPRDPREALRVALHGRPRAVDVGRCDPLGEFFVALGIGFDGAVAARAGRYKRLGGTLPYVLGALQTLATWRALTAEVSANEATVAGPAMMVLVANQPRYGGGIHVAPQAVDDDGQLDVCIARCTSRLGLLELFAKVFGGRHLADRRLVALRGERVHVRLERQSPVHLDGEVAEASEVSVTVLPRALRVAVSG